MSCEVYERTSGETVEQALERVRPDIVVIRSSLLKEPQLEAAAAALERLQLVMRAGAGVDNIAVAFLRQRGVAVANACGANAVAVAELTMAHLLNLDRRLSDQVVSLRAGEWRRLEFAQGPRGLHGQTLAVLGFGSIGREVAKRALAFGMNVRAWSRSLTKEAAAAEGVTWCSSPLEAVDEAYAMSVHLPLAQATRALVSTDLLAHLQPGALLVDVSRSGVVDQEAALHAAAERGLRIGLDVFAKEPGAADRVFENEEIRASKQVYGTHHTGARTAQAAQALEDAIIFAVSAHLQGQPVPGVIK